MRLLVQHRSNYRYPAPALLGTHTLRLHPAAHAKANIETYRLSCEQAERIRWTLDPYGNRVAQLSFAGSERQRELAILVEMAVEIRPVNPFDFFVDPRCSELGFVYPDEYRSELEPFLRAEDPAFETGPRFEALLAELPSSGDTVQALVEFNRRTHASVGYVVREEAGVRTPEQTLEQGRGSCRDSAVLLVALLRRRGIAARFVSGYLIQVTDEGMLPDLPKGLDHDVADLHAWAEAYVPGAGWIGLDATSGLFASEGHIPLACASTPALAAPLFGSADVLADAVEFSLSVARLGHEPRPTAPYTDEVWTALREAGRRCDARLAQLGLRLTMGACTDTQAHIEQLETIHDAALKSDLHGETYLLDGRLAGSGGGHHPTLGGPTSLESPFLQHPDLLASLITFFQHHPSLSYMFTGLFVGPTSPAPRVDEARPEQLDELERALTHAFSQRGQEQRPPWLSDTLFRNLLVDQTGDPHRTELSIAKLFEGVVEFRAFEKPPHPRMAAAQMLLVRSLVTAFAEQPYPGELVRWGRTLHDRFLLPYWMWRDFEDVLAFLAARGRPLDAAGYRPFVDLRCPLVGHLQARDVRVELRNAIEPWHVLDEEGHVDSSLERIEIVAEGLIPERHAILVNGHALPLRPTEHDGLFVGGVRFRAWPSPQSLHSHIHHPLHVDVLDRWAQRSLGACTYHVWHPEGRAFVTPPLTRFEAAARRQQRFTRGDQSPFPVTWSQPEPRDELAYTLDLRRYDPDEPLPE